MRFMKLKKTKAGMVVMLLFSLATITLTIPHHYHWYILHQYLIAISSVVLGLFIEIIPIQYEFGFPNIQSLSIGQVTVMSILGFLVGTLAYSLWTQHRIGKIAVGSALFVNALLGV